MSFSCRYRPGWVRTLACFLLLSFSGTFQCIPIWEQFTGADLPEIRERGKLQVITAYNANSYFIYRGQPMGFEYELLRRLAEHLGVELDIIVTSDMDNIAYMLNSGKGDLVAASITMNRERVEELQFTDHLMLTRQVLVQRARGAAAREATPEEPEVEEDDDSESTPDEAQDESADEVDPEEAIALLRTDAEDAFISDPIELIGKNVSVRRNSVYYERLQNLENEIGGDIDITTVAGDVVTEELIRQVHTGEIDYTVADEPTALINRAYYTNLDVSVPISFSQRIGWVVRRNSPELLKEVNEWIAEIKGNNILAVIHNRYYRDSRSFVQRIESEYYSRSGDRISVFDDEIKERAAGIGWDWRLLASLIYQESRFNPNARSWAGATGLMQLMPATARSMGTTNPRNPTENLRAGTKYLKWLEEQWEEIPDEEERLKFVLASYNAGPGHVEDARILARHFGNDPDVWEGSVDEYILKLSDPDYYNNYGVKYGYCRGQEPYNYVREILERYREYRQFIEESDEDESA